MRAAGQRGDYRHAGRWAVGKSGYVLLLLVLWSSKLVGQDLPRAQWIVGGGAGAILRTVHRGSFGWNLQAARMLQPAPALFLEPGVIFQHYGRSSTGGDVCPDEGCPPPLENAVSIVGPEIRASYREPESNPVYPVAGIGLYRVSSLDTTGIRFGASVGLAISLRRSGMGPALDFRYSHIFGDSRFKSLFPFALRWSF